MWSVTFHRSRGADAHQVKNSGPAYPYDSARPWYYYTTKDPSTCADTCAELDMPGYQSEASTTIEIPQWVVSSDECQTEYDYAWDVSSSGGGLSTQSLKRSFRGSMRGSSRDLARCPPDLKSPRSSKKLTFIVESPENINIRETENSEQNYNRCLTIPEVTLSIEPGGSSTMKRKYTVKDLNVPHDLTNGPRMSRRPSWRGNIQKDASLDMQ